MSDPPPPRIPYPHTLTAEQEECLSPRNLTDITHDALERVLGTRPVDLSLYERAFTHPSSGRSPDYESLEFLGDSVLSLVVTKWIFDTYQDEGEGFMTILKSKLTRSSMLAHYSRCRGLQQFVYMSGKSVYRGFHNSKKTLEDVFESTVGALYLDHGLVVAKRFILETVEHHTPWDEVQKQKNYKDQLMRFCHATKRDLPAYVSTKDPDHRQFIVTISMDAGRYNSSGMHKTKKGAEQEAAKHILIAMGEHVDL
jgi:ribonuclease-3